ncbi:MAG: hypothetical protein V4568_18260 [Pseudomonadota bacterium]
MLIDGVPIDEGNKDQTLERLRALGTGFPERTMVRYSTIEQPQDLPDVQQAVSAFREWKTNPSDATLKQVYDSFSIACRTGEIACANEEADFNELAHAERLQVFGRACCSMQKPDEGIIALERAVAIYDKHQYVRGGSAGGLQSALTELCDALVNYVSAIKQHSGNDELLEEQRRKLWKYTKQATHVFHTRDGGTPVDPSAHRVEQGEIVFFDKNHSVGMKGVADCLGFSLARPEIGAATHYDVRSAIRSLQLMFDRVLEDMPNAHTVGASFLTDNDDESLESPAGRSAINVNRLNAFLLDKKVNISSAAVGDPNQPADVVIGPNYQIKEAVPGRHNPDMALSLGKLLIMSWDKPLHIAADLTCDKTVSDKRAPLLLRPEEVGSLWANGIGKQIEELYPWTKAQTGTADDSLPAFVGGLAECALQYGAAFNRILGQLRDVMDALPVKPDETLISKAVQIIKEHSIHIGSEANVANQPMIDFIKTQLFSVHTAADTGEQYVTGDLEGLKAITYDEQPINTIHAAYQKALDHIVGELDKTITTLAGSVQIDPSHREQVIQVIRSHSIAIGEGAEQANQPLVQFIQNELFKPRDFSLRTSHSPGFPYAINIAGLKKLAQPRPAVLPAPSSSSHAESSNTTKRKGR